MPFRILNYLKVDYDIKLNQFVSHLAFQINSQMNLEICLDLYISVGHSFLVIYITIEVPLHDIDSELEII